MRNVLLAAAAMSVLAVPAFAQSNPEPRGYGSLGYTHMEGDVAQTGAVSGRLGVDLNRYLARGGYGHTELKQELAGAETKVGGDSWNYGVGANYYLDGVNGIRADWTRRDFRDDRGEADAYSVSYIRRF